MALRFVSPTGNQPAGYAAYYTGVRAAIAAAQNGDEIVLEMSTAHTWDATNATLSNRSFVVRNELNNLDYGACVVTVASNAALRFSNNAADRHALTMRGITFSGAVGGYAEYTPATNSSFLRFIGVQNTDIRFQGVAWRRFKWAAGENGGSALRGLAFGISPDITTYRPRLFMSDCLMSDMQADAATDAIWHRAAYCDETDAIIERSRFEDFGRPDFSSGVQLRFEADGATNILVRFKDCDFARLYCSAPGGTVNPPDGSAFCSSFTEHDDLERYFFEDCTFTDCWAGKSGAVHFGRNAAGMMWRCRFTRCNSTGPSIGGGASGRGGQDNANLTNGWTRYYSCAFEDCGSAGQGGALVTVVENAQVVVEHASFAGCSAPAGSAIYVRDMTSAVTSDLFVLRNAAVTSLGAGGAALQGSSTGDNFGEVTNCYLPNGTADMSNVNGTVTGTRSGTDPLAGAGLHLGYRLGLSGRLMLNPPPIGADLPEYV